MCNIYNIGGVHDILYRNIFSSKKKLAYTLLSFIDEDTDSYLIQLWIFIHHTYIFIH